MQQEQGLQTVTRACVGQEGPRSEALDRIFAGQQERIAANITLLEQRYAALPSPIRFNGLREKLSALHARPQSDVDRERLGVLPALVAEHLRLLVNIDDLIARGAEGQRGEVALREVARSHEEMAWMLNALLKEDAAAPVAAVHPARTGTVPSEAEARWEGEGGTTPPVTRPLPAQQAGS